MLIFMLGHEMVLLSKAVSKGIPTKWDTLSVLHFAMDIISVDVKTGNSGKIFVTFMSKLSLWTSKYHL